ncbi:MAG TPA: hypothetical protein VFP12_07165 [Allosphingosinicella sp.]|nr:hypothetical protein [Allosphingosinicella sp.]
MIADPRWDTLDVDAPSQHPWRYMPDVLTKVVAPILAIASVVVGGLASFDPDLLKSRAESGLTLAAAAGLAIATVVFATRLGTRMIGAGVAQIAQREQQGMWEAIDEMERAVDAATDGDEPRSGS